ncbi:MAG: OmpA family protein [Hyphomonas sp.]|uniref:OmpA family protein n=1 Tax=Hyphomonas sp. TaxID=87 RepID=UPI0032974807
MLKKYSLIPVVFLSLLSAQSAWACTDRDAAVAAVQGNDFTTATTLYARIDVDPACPDDFRGWLAEALARESFRQAQTAGIDAETAQSLYQQSLSYAPHWRTYDALGRLAGQQGDFTREAQLLEQAITQLKEGSPAHSATQTEVADLVARTSDAMLLSDTVIAPTRTRSGAPGGIFSEELRGFAIEEVRLAITFEFDSTELTDKGRGYVRQLLNHLMEAAPASITLEGHTDPKGEDAYNMDLSFRRAEALAEFLTENGFRGEINLVGKGETELPAPTEAAQLDTEEYYQRARRVVFKR